LQCLHRCVDVLGMKLARLTSLYQVHDILKGCTPVKTMPKGLTDQRVG
jgi:hypothetical protein